ncbi:MAG: TRAP transporter TatT component family protein [Pyrinomonadaceae bacterium]|nr:TRAP transporter TatT component family protein [Pyrinomonadaceae bacterium]
MGQSGQKSGGVAIQAIIRQADELYAGRQRIENVRASIAILKSAETSEYEILWRLGRALFFLGQEAPDKDSALSKHCQGVVACEQAVASASERVEGHFWLAVNLALAAQRDNPVRAITNARRAMRELQQAIRIDSSYHGAGPLRVLARLQHKLPRLLGGGSGSARANYKKAINLAPENTVTRIYYAELLLDSGERDLAREQLQVVLNVSADPDWAFEIERDQRMAKEMLVNKS